MSPQSEEHKLNVPAGPHDGQSAEPSKSALVDQYQDLLNQGPQAKISGNNIEVPGVKAGDSGDTPIGPTDPNAIIKLTVMVKSKASEKEMDQTIEQIAEGKQKPLTDAQFEARFGADPAAMARVVKFAQESHLTVDSTDLRSGKVEMEGTVLNISEAFGVMMQDYKSAGTIYHQSTGNALLPRDMSRDIEGVFGLNNRPLAQPQFIKGTDLDDTPMPLGSHMPNQVADIYHFPKESMGAGQSVGLVELGGGLDPKDNSQYYKDHNLKEPKIQIVGVDGSQSKVGDNADGEVALDSQIIGAVAPDANQQLAFAPNTDQGFADSITRLTFPQKGEAQNSAISISWGAPEQHWDSQSLHSMHLAFKKAALKGISVFAAPGDWGAQNNATNPKYSMLYPASDPLVTGTGGSTLDPSGAEAAWNDTMGWFPGGAGGGGISEKFPVPDFQKGIKMPEDLNDKNHFGRGVPDVAGDASITTGYIVRFGGSEAPVGGTSCVAPLYAALVLRVNGALGRPVGYLNPFLYKNGNTPMFHDITDGNNNGYNAGPGWDAVTGLGSINGDEFLKRERATGS